MGIFGNNNKQESSNEFSTTGITILSLDVDSLKDKISVLQDKIKDLTCELAILKYKDIYNYLDKNPNMRHFIFNSDNKTDNKKQDVIYKLLCETFTEINISLGSVACHYDYLYRYYIGYGLVCLSKVIEDLEAMRTKLKEAKQND